MSRKEYKENHTRAWCYFIAMGKLPVDAKKNEWVLHHADMTLKALDPVRYNEWRVEDLVPMLRAEHAKLHGSSRTLSEETKRKISQANTGKRRTLEQRQRISDATRIALSTSEAKEHLKNRPKPSDELKQKISKAVKAAMDNHEVRDKISKGRKAQLWWTDGILEKPAKDCPGEGWTRGRRPSKMKREKE